MCMNVSVVALGGQRPGVGLAIVVNCSMWMLGTEFVSSVRATRASNC